jgi:hypothetical protein
VCENKINIITYNIQKFPWSMESLAYEIRKLINSHSTILFQECFNDAYDSLEIHYPNYYM